MADWLTHTLVGWITGKTTRQDAAVVVVGSLLPDLTKISLVLTWLGLNDYAVLDSLHTPVGALLVASIIALFFSGCQTRIPLLESRSHHPFNPGFLPNPYFWWHETAVSLQLGRLATLPIPIR